MLRGRQRDRPARAQPDHVVLPAAGHPDRARLRPAAAVPARATTCSTCSGTPSLTDVAGTFNVAGDGVLMLSPGAPPARSARRAAAGASRSAASARRCRSGPARRLLARAARRSSPTAAASTPPGCAPSSASSRAYTTAEAFADFGASLRPTGGRTERAARRRWPARLAAQRDARELAWEPTMGDAEIIPIGTRGRPGRGTGKTSRRRPRAAWPARSRRRRRQPKRRADASRRGRRAAEPARRPPRKAPTAEAEAAAGRGVRAARRRRAPPAATHPRPRRRRAASPPATGWPRSSTPPRRSSATQWEPQLAQFLAFLRRRVTGDYVVDEYGFDPEITERFFMAALRPIAEKWFRIEVRGVENIPAEGGALVVSNHSGTRPGRRPDDDGLDPRRTPAATCARSAPTWSSGCRSSARSPARAAPPWPATRTPSGCSPAASWSASGPRASRASASRTPSATSCSASAAAASSSAALRTGVPIVPLSVVGAEEIYPLVGNMPSLARLLGVPYIPITPFFPLLGPLGLVPLPSKWLLEFGEPIRTDELRRRRGRRPDAGLQRHRPGARDDPADALLAADAAPVGLPLT